MDGKQWEQVQALFRQAVEQPVSERFSFLKAAARDDDQLFADVQALLEEDARASILDRPLPQLAADVVAASGRAIFSQQFGPYRIRKLLGEGGMGVVYLGEREDLGSVAAIKLLRDAWMSPARRERFTAEQRTLAQLSHPSIARLYDADTLEDGTPWFAMEYVEGLSLTEYCSRHSCGIAERLRLFAAVCEAVRYAHSRAVIHRDLKPSNILAQADGTVKLLDFGIAKQLDAEGGTNQTLTGLRLMTPAYAAPEQIRGEQAGTYSDVYSLGVILYELLTGRLPFDLSTKSPGEAELTIVNEDPQKPSLVAKRADGQLSDSSANWADLDVLCLTAMHKNPERRYRSVDAFLRDLEHYQKGEPLDARPDTLGYRVGKFVRRNRRPVMASALVLAAVLGLVVFYTVRLRAARNAAVAEAARTERVLRFTLNLFNGGDKEAGPASDLRVTALLDRGVEEAKTLDHDPAVQAELYETLGEVYQKLGVLDRADALLTLALQRRLAMHDSNQLAVAESLIKLGLLRADQAKFDEAEQLVRKGLQATKANAPKEDAGRAMDALGTVLEQRGKYDEAIPVLKEAVRLRSAGNADHAALADSQLELANTYFYAGRYDEAKALNEQLLNTHRQLYGDRHPLVAEDLINLGAIQQELGHYMEAEAFDRRALTITRAFYGEDHYKTAANLTLIARALVKQGRYQDAEALLRGALAIDEKVFGANHPRVASPLNELGAIALMHDQFDEAEAAFRRMVEIYRSAYNGKHYLIGVALANLGSVYMARKDNTQAEEMFRQALGMYAQTLPAGSLNEGITRIKLGHVLVRQNRFAAAEGQTVPGYQILSRQENPTVSWLETARKDLVRIYTALQEPEKAGKILAEQSALRAGAMK
jgi:serine/threonine-protein kinase